MEQIARDPRANFLAVYNANVNRREGAVAMLKWLERETDFFTAPVSSKNHLAQPGGLAVHSLNVWRRLREITVRDMTDRNAPGVRQLSEAEEETVAILGLLHDVGDSSGRTRPHTGRCKKTGAGKAMERPRAVKGDPPYLWHRGGSPRIQSGRYSKRGGGVAV